MGAVVETRLQKDYHCGFSEYFGDGSYTFCFLLPGNDCRGFDSLSLLTVACKQRTITIC